MSKKLTSNNNQLKITNYFTQKIDDKQNKIQSLNKLKPKKIQKIEQENLESDNDQQEDTLSDKDKNFSNFLNDEDSNSKKLTEYKFQIKKSPIIKKAQQIKPEYNYLFYKNQIKSIPSGDYIENMLVQWEQDYEKLERHHGYVQWLFPNKYQSKFNSTSQKLSDEEIDKFLLDPEIGNRQIRSIKLFYDFLGIKLVNEKTGDVQRSDHYLTRYKKTFITSWHNHMRVTRILCHFSVTGFRHYAEKLVEFIEKEMFGDVGYLEFLKNKKQKIDAPLFTLAQTTTKIFEEWYPFRKLDYENEPIATEILEKKCFSKVSEIQRLSIIFLQDEQKQKKGKKSNNNK